MQRSNTLVMHTVLGAVLALSSPAGAMTFDQMRDLLTAGVGSDLVLEQYLAEDDRLDLSSEQLLELKRAGATDTLLRTVITGEAPRQEPTARQSGSNVDLYVDPFGYHLYSWPSAFAYICPTPGCQFSLYYGGYCGWRWRDWDWCDWGRWSWPSGRFACGPRWTAWNGAHPRYDTVRSARSWDREPHGDRGWDRGRRERDVWNGRGQEAHGNPSAAPATRSVDRFRDPARTRHANTRGADRPGSSDRGTRRSRYR